MNLHPQDFHLKSRVSDFPYDELCILNTLSATYKSQASASLAIEANVISESQKANNCIL